MEEWKEYKLGEVLTVKYGKDHKHIAEGDIPIYGSGGIMRFGEKSIYEGPSILIPRKGSLNNIIFANKPFWTVDTMFWTMINEEIANPLFVYYSICKKDFASLNVGTAVPSLTVPVIEDIDILLPSKNKQDEIVTFLKSLDDKIELNKRINDNLEQQAQALFKHWFVDFGPFKNGEFVESELGMIPKGWRVAKLGDIADLIKPSIKPEIGVVYNHYSIPAFDNNKIPSLDKGETIKSNKFAIQDSVIMLSKLNPDHKRIWYVDKIEANAVCSTEFLPFYAKDREQSAFIYCYLNNRQIYREIANGARGTTNSHQRIDANAILSRDLAYNKDTISQFCNIVGAILKQQNHAVQESRRLATLRDTLLPRLMSGEISLE